MNLSKLFGLPEKADKVLDGNPYLNAKRAWNEHVGSLINSRLSWQTAAMLAMLTALAAVGGLIVSATRSKFVPYVVEVDALGRPAGAIPPPACVCRAGARRPS